MPFRRSKAAIAVKRAGFLSPGTLQLPARCEVPLASEAGLRQACRGMVAERDRRCQQAAIVVKASVYCKGTSLVFRGFLRSLPARPAVSAARTAARRSHHATARLRPALPGGDNTEGCKLPDHLFNKTRPARKRAGLQPGLARGFLDRAGAIPLLLAISLKIIAARWQWARQLAGECPTPLLLDGQLLSELSTATAEWLSPPSPSRRALRPRPAPRAAGAPCAWPR